MTDEEQIVKLEKKASQLLAAERILAKARADIIDALYLTTTPARTALDYLDRAHKQLELVASQAEQAASRARL